MKKRGRGLYLKPYMGKGLLNKIIDHLPIDLTLYGNYCGPSPKTKERIAKNVPAISKLDEACKQHDIFYLNNPNTADRNKADMRLAEQAWERVKSSDASLLERTMAYTILNLMKAKAKLGMGLRFNKPYKKHGQLSAVKGGRKTKLERKLSRRVSKKRVSKTKTKKK